MTKELERRVEMAGKQLRFKAMLVIFVISVVIFNNPAYVRADETQFQISIDNDQLQVGVSANLVVSLANAQDAKITEFSGLDNFDVLSNSQSQSTQIMNGAASYQTDINYAIMPKTAGDFTLQATVEYNGKSYQTNALQVSVSQADTQTDTQTDSAEASDIFLKTNLSDKEIYYGQKLALSYELYTRYNLENYGFLNSVTVDNFVSNEVSQDKLTSAIVMLGDNKYAKYEVTKMFLTPIKTGTYTIPSFNFQANASTGDFFSTSQPYYLQSDSADIKVKPLPQDNQPSDFSGIVGKLNIEASYDKQAVEYGDSITLNVTASGNCNLDNLTKVIKDDIPGFSVYETAKSSEESIQDGKYYAKKEFNVILVPENTGEQKIDPIKISYFDPESATYENAEISGTTINVTGEIPKVTTQNQTPASQSVDISQVNYGFEHNDGVITIKLDKNTFYISLLVVVVLLIIVMAILFFIKNRKKYDKTLFMYYKQLIKSNDQKEIYNIFNDMMKYCFDINLKANAREIVVNRLEEHKGMDSGLVGSIVEIMDQMEKMSPVNDEINIKTKIKTIYKKLAKR